MLGGALPRFWRLGVAPFGFDEADISRQALAWVSGGALPLAGQISSTGYHAPPLAVWLFAPPYAFTPDPLMAVAWVALLNLLTVPVGYLVALRLFGRRAAFVSALLLASSPWALLYSRSLWANSLLPLFALLTVLAGGSALLQRRTAAFFLWPVLLSATIQLHISGLVMLVWSGAAALVFYRRLQGRPLVAGALIALLLWLPYLVYQANHWRDEVAAVEAHLTAPAQIDGQILRHMGRLATGADIHSLAGPARYLDYLQQVPYYWPLAACLGLILSAAGLGLLWQLRVAQGRSREAALLLLLWLLAPLPLFLRHSLPLYTHYLLAWLPAPLLAMGASVQWLYARRPALARTVTLLLGAAAVSQLLLFVTLINTVGTQATLGGLGRPLEAWRSAAAVARTLPVCEIKAITDGAWPDWQAEPATVDLLLHGDPRLLIVDGNHLRDETTYRDGRSAIWITPPTQNSTEISRTLYEIGSSTLPPLPSRRDEAPLRILYDDGGRTEATVGDLKAVDFANGQTLLGYAWRGDVAPGGQIRLFLQWGLGSVAEAPQAFNHLEDSAGEKITQADGMICPANQWPAGETVWTWYDLVIPPDAPAGPFHLRTGLYTLSDIRTVARADGGGDSVILPLHGAEE